MASSAILGDPPASASSEPSEPRVPGQTDAPRLFDPKAQVSGKEVRLYYFRDSLKVLQLLRPDYSPGAASASQQADAEKEVIKAGFGLSQAQVKRAGLVDEVRQLRRKVEGEEKKVRSLEAAKRSRSAEVEGLTRDLAERNRRIKALEAQFAEEEDEGRRAALQRRLDAENRGREAAEERKTAADERLAKAEEDLTGAQATLEEVRGETAAAEGSLKKAVSELAAAAELVALRRHDLAVREREEDRVFAESLAALPTHYAAPNPDAADAVGRVAIFAPEGRGVIYLRGDVEDMQEVENLISLYDSPAPQAMLTLYEIQVNVPQTSKGRLSFARQEAKVMEQLSLMRSFAGEASLAFAEAVQGAADQATKQEFSAEDALKTWELANRKQGKLRVSSFGEAVLAYSLAGSLSQQEVDRRFASAFPRARVNRVRTSLGLQPLAEGPTESIRNLFPSFYAQLGRTSGDGTVSPSGTAFLRAFRMRQVLTNLNTLAALWPTVREAWLREGLARAQDVGRGEAPPALAEWSLLSLEDLSSKLRTASLQSPEAKLLSRALQELRTVAAGGSGDAKPSPAISNFVKLEDQTSRMVSLDSPTLQPWLSDLSRLLQPKYKGLVPRSAVTAQVNAADLRIGKISEAFQDDLDRLVIREGMGKVRDTTSSGGVAFGQMKKTSLLVTNRFQARVATRADAELEGPTQMNVLSDVTALAGLISAGPMSATGLLKGLQSLDPGAGQAPAYLTGITSSGTFQVNPAFEPSGQGLRFRLDYAVKNDIRQPDGSVDPAYPRVDRHSINAEIQVGNFEFREVSSYSVNSQLGLPSRKWGGIPVLNSIPLIKELPLIGWFHYRSQRSAVAQSSIVFVHNTMYPTVLDLFEIFKVQDPQSGGQGS